MRLRLKIKSEKHKQNISKALIGKPKSKEHREKMPKFPKGHKIWVGRKHKKESIEKLLGFIASSINKDCSVFIYCTWPRNTAAQLGDFDYSEEWLSDFQENDTLKILSEKYFTYLENSIENNSDKVKFIPLGKVLYHFDKKAKSGEVPGYSGAGELYRDAWHLNNVGRYIAGLTVFSQIFRIDPVGIPDFESYQMTDRWPSDRELTSKQKVVIRKIISEVLDF